MAHLTSLLVVLWVGVTVGTVLDRQKRLIGGHDCSGDERGYHVLLEISTGKDTKSCSGSLISDRWILTAAHCWDRGWTFVAVFGPYKHPVKRVAIRHPPILFEGHDIMLLCLSVPVDIPPVPLPDCDNHYPHKGDEVQVAGYHSAARPGDLLKNFPADLSKPLQCGTARVVECSWTLIRWRLHYPKTFPPLLCYKGDGMDSTPGDSGGAVLFNGMIYGVYFEGGKTAGSVWENHAMDVCGHLEWIKSNTGIP